MTGIIVLAAAAGMALAPFASAQKPPEKNPAQAADELAGSLVRRLSEDLHVKTVIGKPVIAGSVTLIPILTIDVAFGGAGLAAPAQAAAEKQPQSPAAADGFLMSGEARPLGFIAITKKGTRFISLVKAPAK